jgi:hypothetical protein
MLSVARSLIGTLENRPGSNHNFITAWYGFDGPWCDMAVSYEAGHSDNLSAILGKFAYTVALAQAFVNHGRWHFGLGGARPGDVVFFDWGGSHTIGNLDHVGLIEAVHSRRDDHDARRQHVERLLPAPAQRVGGRRLRASRDGDSAPIPRPTASCAWARPARRSRPCRQPEHRDELGSGRRQRVRAAVGRRDEGLAGRPGEAHPTVPKPPPAGTLVVDGIFGPATCAAMQRALNHHGAGLVVDGAFGPLTKKALSAIWGSRSTASSAPTPSRRCSGTSAPPWTASGDPTRPSTCRPP